MQRSRPPPPHMAMPQPQLPAFAFNGFVQRQLQEARPPLPFEQVTLPGAAVKPKWQYAKRDSISSRPARPSQPPAWTAPVPARTHLTPSLHAPSPSVSPALSAFTPQGLPSRKRIVVKLPNEAADDLLWRRAAVPFDFADWHSVPDVQVVTRPPHHDELRMVGLPPSIEIYLPGFGGWQDLLEELRQARTGQGGDDGSFLVCADLVLCDEA
jgi:hypothetical protein